MTENEYTRPSGFTSKKYLWSVLAILFLTIGIYVQRQEYDDGDEATISRRELDPGGKRECVPPSINQFPADLFTQEERQNGYVVVHILATAYLCLILAIVCDQYFVPSLEIIAEHLKVPVDVAGATFMAIGTSSPELYSAVIGSFVTEGDIGVGTIVGSAVFNILGVTSVTGLLLWRTEAPVDWYPVSRDCVVYILSVSMLICIIKDNVVTWLESTLLLTVFVLYIAMMFYNRDIQASCKEKIEDIHTWWKRYRKARSTSIRVRSRSRLASVNRLISEKTLDEIDEKDSQAGDSEQSDDSEESDDDMSPWTIPSESYLQLALWLVTWPALVIITFTIPNCRKPKQSLFLFTFLSSVFWIGLISYLCSWMVTIIGYTFGLPDSVSGITILAAGISVPEIIASVIVVRNGMANMAFSNLIGSNIFDILFCLGLPWFIKTMIFSSNGRLVIHSSALAYSAGTLLSTVVLFFATLSFAGWKLNWRVGLTCLGLYIIFLVVACLCEMNAFSDMNPPTCLT